MDNRNAGSMTDNEKYQISFDACRTQTDSDESYIQTVTGKIRPDQLGYCQCHEHLSLRMVSLQGWYLL